MASWTYPPQQSHAALRKLEDDALTHEVQWLLATIQESLNSLRNDLNDCAALLVSSGHPLRRGTTTTLSDHQAAQTRPQSRDSQVSLYHQQHQQQQQQQQQNGVTLALSTPRSECVKGFITRLGTTVIRGDMHLRLASLPPARGTGPAQRLVVSPHSPSPTAVELRLTQLVSLRRLINDSLDVVDVTTWTGDPTDANFMTGQLMLLHELIVEARMMLKGDEDEYMVPPWWEDSADESSFDPPLPPNVSLHLHISDGALVFTLRTLKPKSPTSPTLNLPEIHLRDIIGISLRETVLGQPRRIPHDEENVTFRFRGEEVCVVEKVSVESQDPDLMSALAKLTVLEHEVSKWRAALRALTHPYDDDMDD